MPNVKRICQRNCIFWRTKILRSLQKLVYVYTYNLTSEFPTLVPTPVSVSYDSICILNAKVTIKFTDQSLLRKSLFRPLMPFPTKCEKAYIRKTKLWFKYNQRNVISVCRALVSSHIFTRPQPQPLPLALAKHSHIHRHMQCYLFIDSELVASKRVTAACCMFNFVTPTPSSAALLRQLHQGWAAKRKI